MKLYEYQQNILDETRDKNKVAYYLDMGLGKTFVGSEKMISLGSKINLIVCQKSKVDDWLEHFENHYPDALTYNLREKSHLEIFSGLSEYPQDKIAIGVINYDTIWRRKELSNLKDFTLLLDESSLIQNPTTERTRFITRKLNPENVILLSGTPTGGKYEKLLTQLHLLGWKISNDMYWNIYVDWKWEDIDGFYQKKVEGYKNVERLKRKMRQYGCIFLKTEEVINLPKQNDIKVSIPVTKDYNIFAKEDYLLLENGTELIGDTTLNKMLYQRQLCGVYNEDKFKAFLDLLKSTEDRIIVFYNFQLELEKLKECIDRPCSVINGSEKNLKAYDDCENSITFAQYQAGAMGLNLQKANKIIYFTPPLSSELFEQSKKRIHRIGQNKACFYYYLTCKKSIEEKIYKALAMRRDYTNELFKEEA